MVSDFSFLPNAHRFPHRGIRQPSKADMRNVVKVATERTQHIQKVDRRIGAPESFRILFDVLSLIEKETGNGISVRDLTPLQDGNYYLPALLFLILEKTSVPSWGKL